MKKRSTAIDLPLFWSLLHFSKQYDLFAVININTKFAKFLNNKNIYKCY